MRLITREYIIIITDAIIIQILCKSQQYSKFSYLQGTPVLRVLGGRLH